MQALDTALSARADMFEFDVRRCGDGSIVVHHDPEIASCSLAMFDYSGADDAARQLGYRLPRLKDVLRVARGRIQLDVELKQAGYEDLVIEEVVQSGFDLQSFVVTSFEPNAVTALRAAHPEVETGLLVYDVSGPEALKMFKQAGASFLGPDYRILDDTTLREAEAAEIRLLPWTVNDPFAIQRLLGFTAVTGVITDNPAAAVRIRDGEPA
jgi:glycerophosphoryl diester phosphodiesterase